MAICPKTSKILWSSAAGHCSFPQCKEKLYEPDAGQGYTTGEMAHINGEKPGSNRYDCNQAAGERDGYSNLILLCPMHHTAIDKPENEKKDIRTTLYWNPNIILSPGKRQAVVTFYNNDVSDYFRVVIEGMTSDGRLAHIEQVME